VFERLLEEADHVLVVKGVEHEAPRPADADDAKKAAHEPKLVRHR
jgi:hypothetical protein